MTIADEVFALATSLAGHAAASTLEATISQAGSDLLGRWERIAPEGQDEIKASLSRLTRIGLLKVLGDPSVGARLADEVAVLRSWAFDGHELARQWYVDLLHRAEEGLGAVIVGAAKKALLG